MSGSPEWEHEKRTAEKIAKHGLDFSFNQLKYGEGVKNPDVKIFGEVWEFKSPKGSSEKSTIDSQFKRGKKQASRLVIDLERCGLPDELAVSQIERRFYGATKLEKIIVIDKKGNLHKYGRLDKM